MLDRPRNVFNASQLLIPEKTNVPTKGYLGKRSPVGGPVKRIIDLTVAVLALVMLMPIFAIIAVVIKLTSPGPIFFRHPRVGFQGDVFQCFKFRTMATNSEAILADLLFRSPASAAEWFQKQKLSNDPRVTNIGHFLRKSSLDELPQLFNILLGQMSFVGPRPVTQAELKRYGRSACKYLAARPGLTGLWQVSGRSSLTYSRRVALDRYYVARWSLLLDLAIILKTVPALIRTTHTS